MIEIRTLTINDTDALIVLLAQLWTDKPIDRTEVKRVIEKGLNSGSQTYICATDGGKLIGYCSLTVKNNLWLEANSGIVDELVVDEVHRNRGVGKMLMAEIERIAKDSECKRLDVESADHRVVAHEFYEELGFEKYEYSSYYFAKEI
ncbi:MAG: GNAT family N-acetyltransferase [Cytophagaceae bacterium]|jgi:ribosomal protein S18 acetylase RimI-like enzyme|nr:GNAT family N-acetyltransferase [Cytophagaceae bacterium]